MVGNYETLLEAELKIDELMNISIKKYGKDKENPKVSWQIFEAFSGSVIMGFRNRELMAKEFYNWI